DREWTEAPRHESGEPRREAHADALAQLRLHAYLGDRLDRWRQRMRALGERTHRHAVPRDAPVVAERNLLVGRRLEALHALRERLAQRALGGGAHRARILAQH